MSNNTPDYENNSAFAPTSADDLGEQGRQSEVLIKALEKCERLEAENQQLKELLKEVRDAWVIYKPYDRNQLCKRIDNAIGDSDDKK